MTAPTAHVGVKSIIDALWRYHDGWTPCVVVQSGGCIHTRAYVVGIVNGAHVQLGTADGETHAIVPLSAILGVIDKVGGEVR